MKRHIPGLHQQAQSSDDHLEGLFLVRVERAFYRWHPQKPFFALRLAILEPKEHTGQMISGRLYCTPKALWKLNWFLRDFDFITASPPWTRIDLACLATRLGRKEPSHEHYRL